MLLLADPDKTLKPKLQFFNTLGISGPTLGKIISSRSCILTQNLENTIIPSVNYLRGLVGTDKLPILLSRIWQLFHNTEFVMGSNIAFLRHHGVPHSNVTKFIIRSPQSLHRNSDLFNKAVLEVVRIGIDPTSMNFLDGLHVLMALTKPAWDKKVTVCRSFGWSDDEILETFKRNPRFMTISAKKMTLALEFFMNSLKWTPEDVSRNSTVISLSLKRRVIPRCHVLQILLSKHLIRKISIGQALRDSDVVFLKKYVSNYHNEVPDLLKAYQSKLNTQGESVQK
ncbi:hypothetical protein ACHQM5_000917 [Ranunculus cassubicifolius]